MAYLLRLGGLALLTAFLCASGACAQPHAEDATADKTAAGAHDKGGAHDEKSAHTKSGTHEADPFATDPISWDADLALWTFVMFLVLLLVLSKFAWKPIAKALEEREHAIESNIAKAEGAAAEARAMLADYEKKLAGASDEVRAMLEEARRDAEHTKQEIVAEARVAAKEEHDRVMRDIGTAKDQALKELAERSTNIAVDLAGKIVRAQLSKSDHMALVQEAMGKFASKEPN
jgi:F-type H+-transporting ATPase subunit b